MMNADELSRRQIVLKYLSENLKNEYIVLG